MDDRREKQQHSTPARPHARQALGWVKRDVLKTGLVREGVSDWLMIWLLKQRVLPQA